MKRAIVCLLVTFGALSNFQCIQAQSNKIMFDHRAWTVADGLPSNDIHEMLQDNEGYLWLASVGGLARFDGYQFMPLNGFFDGGDNNTIHVANLVMNSRKRELWVISAVHHVSCLDLYTGRFPNYNVEGDINRQYSGAIVLPSGVWLSELQNGVRHIVRKSDGYECYDYSQENGKLPGKILNRLYADKNNGVWVCTDNGLVRISALHNPVLYHKGTAFSVGAVYGNDMLFVSKDNRVLRYNAEGKQVISYDLPVGMGSTAHTRTAFVWQNRLTICTGNATFELNLKTGKYSVPSYQISDGRLQFQTDKYTLIANKSGVLYIFGHEGLPHELRLMDPQPHNIRKNRLYTAASMNDSILCIATYGEGLYLYNVRTRKICGHYLAQDPDPILPGNTLQYIMRDGQNNIWVSCVSAGLVCLTPITNKMYEHKADHLSEQLINGRIFRTSDSIYHQPAEVVSDVIHDARGRTWIGTWGKGVLVNNKAFLASTINQSRIHDLTLSSGGLLWIATNNGLYKIDTNKADISDNDITLVNTVSNELSSLFAMGDSLLWVGTVGGGVEVLHFNSDGREKRHTIIDRRAGLASNIVRTILADRYGNVWVATEQNLSRVNPKTREIKTYKLGTNLQENMYRENWGQQLSDGRLLFGTNAGTVIIDPTVANREPQQRGNLTVTDLHVNGMSLYASAKNDFDFSKRKVCLPHTGNTLTFYFSDFNFSESDGSLYQYYLEGSDKDWRTPTVDNHAEYANLIPGTYRFRLRHLVNGQWQECNTFTVIIRHPWYNTWWAWLIYILIVGAVVWRFYQQWKRNFELRQQMNMEQQLTEYRLNFFTSLIHEFRTPLAIIRNAIDRIGQSASPTNAKVSLQTARRNVGRMLRLVNELAEFRKLQKNGVKLHLSEGDIVTFIRDIWQDLWPMGKEKEINMSFTPFAKHYVVAFDDRKVEMMVYNLLSNAIKYTPNGGNITVSLKQDGDKLLFVCEDNGSGIKGKQLEYLYEPFVHGHASSGGIGIGLFITKSMAELHHGTLNYEQVTEQGGSRFTLTLPAQSEVFSPDDFDGELSVAKRDDESVIRHAEEIIREMMPQALNSERVVIIEDDADMMTQIRSEVGNYFETEGYANGLQGYEAVLANPPALLLCDVMLPDMNGYDIVHRLKQDERFLTMPVIMLSSLVSDEHRMKGYKAGADDYMVKPCNYKVLVVRIMQLIAWSKKVEPGRKKKQKKETDGGMVGESSAQTQLYSSIQDKKLKERIDLFIAQHLTDNISVDEMAAMLNLGHTKFYGKMKELTGMSPNKYIVSVRLRIAADLLLEGKLNISEIAYRTGFQDQAYFNRCFKQKYGVAPSKYGTSH